MHKLARKRMATLAMVDDDSSSSVLGEEVVADSTGLADSAESISESILAGSVTEMDTTVSFADDDDVAKELVIAAITDSSTKKFLNGEGVVADIPPTEDMSETVSAVLAASEMAAAAADATLSVEEAEKVPLIPKRAANDTVGIAPIEEKMTSILPASSVVGEPATTVPVEIDTPDVKKILKFAIPAIGVWLCGPLLSLIDTSAVGLFSGTAQQAALNPAVAVTDYAALLIVRTASRQYPEASESTTFSNPCFFAFVPIRRSCTLRPRTWSLLHKRPIGASRGNLALPRT